MKKKDFEAVAHTADIQIRVYGKTMKELFCNALIGMFQSVGPRSPECETIEDRLVCNDLPYAREITIKAHGYDNLLVDFLSQALTLSDIHDEVYLDVNFETLSDEELRATVYGVRITGFQNVEIKAVTYHKLHVQQLNGYWQTDVVFDI